VARAILRFLLLLREPFRKSLSCQGESSGLRQFFWGFAPDFVTSTPTVQQGVCRICYDRNAHRALRHRGQITQFDRTMAGRPAAGGDKVDPNFLSNTAGNTAPGIDVTFL